MKRAVPRYRRGVQNAPADPADLLAKLARLPIKTWSYTFEPGVRHIGPMAQDFAAVFGVGSNPRRIQLNDAVGIAFAAIQGLLALLRDNDARLATLRAELKALGAGQGVRGNSRRPAARRAGSVAARAKKS